MLCSYWSVGSHFESMLLNQNLFVGSCLWYQGCDIGHLDNDNCPKKSNSEADCTVVHRCFQQVGSAKQAAGVLTILFWSCDMLRCAWRHLDGPFIRWSSKTGCELGVSLHHPHNSRKYKDFTSVLVFVIIMCFIYFYLRKLTSLFHFKLQKDLWNLTLSWQVLIDLYVLSAPIYAIGEITQYLITALPVWLHFV